MNNSFFSDILSTIADRGRSLLDQMPGRTEPARGAAGLMDLCERLLSGRGEASGTALAREILDRYADLDEGARHLFFEGLAQKFGPDRERLEKAVGAWAKEPTDENGARLHYLSEPRRQELFRRLNRAPGGTSALVEMRADLLPAGKRDAAFDLVDRDLVHLLTSWFNRGFLVLRRIDWASPANVLEKIIRYEAVHAIRDWDDLRRRIDPPDRRCYAFFHPALIDEPLIFVEVALVDAVPAAIAPLLAQSRTITRPEQARTAVFYSISNCQFGLTGISFGNFLIKQVVEELRREWPRLTSFVTLSPVPGFMAWLRQQKDRPLTSEQARLLSRLDEPDWPSNPSLANDLKSLIEPLAAFYFCEARSGAGRVIDPVARFHLGNGAMLERINWLGDRSPKGMGESAGLMVNYLYDLDRIETNHEAYANSVEVVASAAVKRLLRAAPRSKTAPAGSIPPASA